MLSFLESLESSGILHVCSGSNCTGRTATPGCYAAPRPLLSARITLPPLRNCREDIMPLAEFFREQSNKTLNKAVRGFDSSAKKALQLHPWSGNVRELKQKIQTAVLLYEDNNITEDDLELYIEQGTTPICYSLKDVQQEKDRIRQALGQCGGNKKSAAKLLKISRTTLYAKIKEYGLNKKT